MRTEREYNIQYRCLLWEALYEVPLKDLGNAAEIGVAEGNFSEDILRWPVQFPKLLLVDRWHHVGVQGDSAKPQRWHEKNRQQVISRMKQFGDRAWIMQMDSELAASKVPDNSLHFVNIDANHTYAAVAADIRAWHPKMKRGGVMAFHDYEVVKRGYGVKRAVLSFTRRNRIPLYLLSEDKPEDAGAFFIC